MEARLARGLLSIALVAAATACDLSCPAALLEGVLVRSGDSDLVVKADADGRLVAVAWPFGVGVRPDGNSLVLAASFGTVIAREGDRVRIGGGERPDGTWNGCGGITVMPEPLGRAVPWRVVALTGPV